VIGAIHGDETAGVAITDALTASRSLPAGALFVVPDLNPDGAAVGHRQNGRGVDLNRNFPYQWAPIGHPGDQQYAGAGALSEPESRAMAALIRRVRPRVTVWFHQPVGVVDESGGSVPIERRFARLLGEPLRRLTRYHGSVAGWQNTTFADTTAFVVELPRHLTRALKRRAVAAVEDLFRRSAP
jgi:protein MpaA